MKKFVCLFALLLCAFAFVGCGEKEEDKVTFGLLGPFTGGLSAYGTAVRDGAILAIDELNAKGGILGKKVAYVEQDTEGDSGKVLSAYNSMIDDIDFLIGEVTSGNTEIAVDQSNKDKMLTITPSATAAGVTKNRPYIFRACFLDPTQGETMAEFSKDEGYKKVAVVYDNSDDYSKGVAEAYAAKAQALGLEVALNDGGLKAGDNDQRNAIITKITAAEVDAVFASIYYQDAAQLAKGLRAKGFDKPLLGADGYDGILGQLEGTGDVSAANNVFFSNHYCATDAPIVEFTTKFKAKFSKDPASFAALAYDAVMIAAKAMEEAKSTDADEVLAKLTTLTFEGLLTGDIKFDKEGDPVKTICVNEYKDGKMVLAKKYTK